MNDRSSNAYFYSILLHGGVVALILLLGYISDEPTHETPKIFELVAGAGDNYAATEAPALGVPDGIKMTVTSPAAPAPTPEPPAPVEVSQPPEAVPIQPAPKPVPAPPVPQSPPRKATPIPPKTEQVPNFSKQVQRTASRKAARLEAKYKKQLEAEEKKRESYEQFLKEQKGQKSPSGKMARVDAEGIREGVIGGSTANKKGGAGGKALSRQEQDLLDSYFAMLKVKLKENHVPPPDVSDKLATRVEFFLSADGSISRVRIMHSSGSAAFDRSVLDAFAQTRMPPRPDGRSDSEALTFSLREEDSGP